LNRDRRDNIRFGQSSSLNDLDLKALIKVLDKNWRTLSNYKDFPMDSLHYIKGMRLVRNRWAHKPAKGFDFDTIFRDLDTMELFAEVIEAPADFTDKVRASKIFLLNKIHSKIPKSESRHCVCCCGREVVNPKAFFISGHDGRVSGWFRKILKDKMKIDELNPKARKLWDSWNILGRPGGESHPRLRAAAEKVFGER
jgi:hypothetical protein